MGARKLSISMDEELVERVLDDLDGESLSGYLASAAADRLERSAMRRHIAELDEVLGPADSDGIREFDDAWPS